MKKFILLALFMVFSQSASAITPFTITDIRVEGLQRLEAGTVFNYLPLKVGDEVNDEETRLSIKALFQTGFFTAVSLEQDGTVLVVKVVERPSIASVTINGNDRLKTEQIEQGLEQAGLVAGRIFNTAILGRVEQEIKNAYLSMGRYSASVETTEQALDQNRVAITLEINEGRVARIKKINIIGAEKVAAGKLKDEMQLKEKRGFRLFSRQDQYSKQKLEADLETIRSYYLNRGYHEFEIVSSSVEIGPNRQSIFISVTINEGDLFRFGETVIEGIAQDRLPALRELVEIEPGGPFSRQQVNATRTALSDVFADEGYAFVEVRPVFSTAKPEKIVSTVFSIIPNQRVYVRRIDISGNIYTRDEVIRRELRQLEGAWYSATLVSQSRDRLQRLGIFENVQIETPVVAGVSDQVDMKVIVSELDTGSVLFSAGFSDEDGVLFGVEFEQRNLLGTGKDLAIKLNNSDAADTAVISYTNPYHTASGISRTFNLAMRKVDSAEIDTAAYILNTNSLGVLYKIPIAETNSLNLGAAFEKIELEETGETPEVFGDVIKRQPDSGNLIFTAGLSKDTRDQFFFPTRGGLGSISAEISAPGSGFEYYKLNAQGTYYYSMGDRVTLKGGLGLGFGDSYRDSNSIGLPFFKNYFAGGPRSVRGYDSRSLGPREKPAGGGVPVTVGGDSRVLTNLELLFPAFGTGNSKDKRFGLFADGGQVYAHAEGIDLGDMRYSAGLFFHWFSAVGPFAFSYGVPLNAKADDKTEELQISIGTVFR